MIIEDNYEQSLGTKHRFKHKKILFIGSESYDAPTITVLEGLTKLGFVIYTLNKPNINSWFCNKIIENTNNVRFDFVLSNLHWGTQWSLYEKHKLNHYFKVLIDGDDNHQEKTWKDKYARYIRTYKVNPSEEVKAQNIMPYRWVETLDGYEPDMVFTSQKQFEEHESMYLPFGIHDIYKRQNRQLNSGSRTFMFAHVSGEGTKRKAMKKRLDRWVDKGWFTKKTFNGLTKGKEIYPEGIKHLAIKDDNIHSYHRWVMRADYFELLNQSNVLVYPGIGIMNMPFWDSKRPWEAYANGCLVMMEKPVIDVSMYPITEINPFAVYKGTKEFYAKSIYLTFNKYFLQKQRLRAVERANKYFSSTAIANYFLMQIFRNKSYES